MKSATGFFGALLVLLAVPPQAMAEVTVDLLEGLAGAGQENSLTNLELGDDIEVYDLIQGQDAGTWVGLECPSDSQSSATFEGEFELQLQRPQDVDCHIELRRGKVYFLADGPVLITDEAGAEVESSGTQFSVTVTGSEMVLELFDGQAMLRAPDGREVEPRPGQRARLRRDSPDLPCPESIGSTELGRAAENYARFEVRRGRKPPRLENRDDAERELREGYAALFRAPGDERARRQVLDAYERNSLRRGASYHERRLRPPTSSRFEKRPRVLFTKARCEANETLAVRYAQAALAENRRVPDRQRLLPPQIRRLCTIIDRGGGTPPRPPCM